MTTRRSLSNTMGEPIAPTIYPYGPQWDGHITNYTPSAGTPHSPGVFPPPENMGTMRKDTTFPLAPSPKKEPHFGAGVQLTFELRRNSTRNQPGPSVSVPSNNSTPLSKLIDRGIQAAMNAGMTQTFSRRILGVFGPSGRQLDTGFGYTLKDQSPPVPPGSTIVLVFQDD